MRDGEFLQFSSEPLENKENLIRTWQKEGSELDF